MNDEFLTIEYELPSTLIWLYCHVLTLSDWLCNTVQNKSFWKREVADV